LPPHAAYSTLAGQQYAVAFAAKLPDGQDCYLGHCTMFDLMENTKAVDSGYAK
jgi:hypothetical protein